MFGKIVVPLDGSEEAEEVLPHVLPVLRRADAELILVHTANPTLLDLPPVLLGAAREEARTYLSRVEEPLHAEGVKVRSRVEHGVPASEIVRVVEEEKASLVALTTHGPRGVGRVLLGSEAEDVLRLSPVPVLAVRARHPAPPPPPTEPAEPIRKVLVPLDGSERALHAFVPAAELCRLFRAQLLFLRVLEKADPEERSRAKAHLEEVEERSRAIGVEAQTSLAEGDPVDRILEVARAQRADLIAMATHGRRGLARLATGSVAKAVLRKSTLPVLIVRSNGIPGNRDRERLVRGRA